MKFTIILSSLIIGGFIYLSTDKYEFHYQGVEEFGNNYSIYKMNKESGEVVRLTYDFYEEDDGTKLEQITQVSLDDGRRYVINVE